ncbi:hypothetical protein HAX54_010401 [Datura stramonium]|uniref:Uncharacterized protein n=1 Tax=Datura stramonium TaxID=4076 RepID=A0ABS8X0Y8_DATST|nr:hypothetical protein [Datura stramonium]
MKEYLFIEIENGESGIKQPYAAYRGTTRGLDSAWTGMTYRPGDACIGATCKESSNKRSRVGEVEPNEDARIPPQPPRPYGLRWVKDKKSGRPVNVVVIIKDVLSRARGLDVMKAKEPKCIYGHVLSINESNTRIDNVLSNSEHSRAPFNGRPGFEELFNDDDATDEEHAIVNSNLQSDDD